MKRATVAVAPILLAVLWVASTPSSATAQDPSPSVSIDPSYGCTVCHADKRRAFIQGVHSERGIRCEDCHGGDPTAVDLPEAHVGGYIGTPDKVETVEVCSSCHADPDQMRQYGLPADELAEFRTSRHGQLLLGEGNADAPTCTSCHDAHTIRTPDDAQSEVYPPNIAGTCAGCHSDASLMDKYGLPTDQEEKHRASAHGVALYQDRNFASPSCIGCHGSHAAMPPRVTEISNVCGQCHVLVRRAFFAGPHGEPARRGELPGCTACHTNHGTERVPSDFIAASCTECHSPDSQAATVGLEIQEQVLGAERDLLAAEEALEELQRGGRDVSDLRFRYQTALTRFQQVGLVQHDLDLEELDDLSRRVGSISRDLTEIAEGSAERRWEHRLLLVPVWFLALSAILLAWFRLRRAERESS